MAKKKRLTEDAISNLINQAMLDGRKLYKSKSYLEAHQSLAEPIRVVGKSFTKHPRAGEILMAVADVLFTTGEIEKAFDAYSGAHGIGGSLVPYLQLRQGQIAIDYLDNRQIKKFGRLIDKDNGLNWLGCAYLNGGENLIALLPRRHRVIFEQYQEECKKLFGESSNPDGNISAADIATTFADVFRLPSRDDNPGSATGGANSGQSRRRNKSKQDVQSKTETPSTLELCKAAEKIAKSGDTKSAIAAFELAYELFDKGSKQVQKRISNGLGELLFQAGKSRKALDPFHDAYNLAIDAKVLLRLGQCYFNIRQRKKALDFLLRAYMLEGKSIFKGEDGKYFEYLESKVQV